MRIRARVPRRSASTPIFQSDAPEKPETTDPGALKKGLQTELGSVEEQLPRGGRRVHARRPLKPLPQVQRRSTAKSKAKDQRQPRKQNGRSTEKARQEPPTKLLSRSRQDLAKAALPCRFLLLPWSFSALIFSEDQRFPSREDSTATINTKVKSKRSTATTDTERTQNGKCTAEAIANIFVAHPMLVFWWVFFGRNP